MEAATATLLLSAVSTAGAVYSTVRQTQAANKAAEYQAQVAARNAQVAEMQADDAEARGTAAERRHRRDVQRFMGLQKTRLAAAGVDVDRGSALDVLDSTAFEGEHDALTLRQNAAREAWGYRVQGADYQAQGQLSRMQTSSPLLAGGTTLLTQAPGVFDRYRTYRQRTRTGPKTTYL